MTMVGFEGEGLHIHRRQAFYVPGATYVISNHDFDHWDGTDLIL